MSRTESTMVQLGTIAPAFELVDVVSGRAMSRDDVFALSWDENLSDGVNTAIHGGPAKKHGLLVMFVCVHCPYVKHVEAKSWRKIGLRLLWGGRRRADCDRWPFKVERCCAISRGWAARPCGNRRSNLDGRFPYLLDESQEVARAYEAACTPDFFLFDARHAAGVSRDSLDDSRPRRGDFGNDIACDRQGPAGCARCRGCRQKARGRSQRSSIGCNIKFRE